MTLYLSCKKADRKRTYRRTIFHLSLLLNLLKTISLSICLSLCFSIKEGHTEKKNTKKKEETLTDILKRSKAALGIRDLADCFPAQIYAEIHKRSLKNCKELPKEWTSTKKKMYIEACRCGSFWIWKKKNALPYYIISACGDLQVYNSSYEKIFSFYPDVVVQTKSYFPIIGRTAFFPMEGKQSILVSGFSKSYARGTIWELILVAFDRKKFYLLTKEFSHRSGTYPSWWFEDANNDGRWELCISYDAEESKKCASWNEKTKKWHVVYSKEKPSSKRRDFPYCGYR